jgi:hypothetical protein
VRPVYAAVLVIGLVGLAVWMLSHSLAEGADRPARDPERRFGALGRRVTGGMVGFGIAGMSAEFASIDIAAPLVATAALVGAGLAAWWAGSFGGEA